MAHCACPERSRRVSGGWERPSPNQKSDSPSGGGTFFHSTTHKLGPVIRKQKGKPKPSAPPIATYPLWKVVRMAHPCQKQTRKGRPPQRGLRCPTRPALHKPPHGDGHRPHAELSIDYIVVNEEVHFLRNTLKMKRFTEVTVFLTTLVVPSRIHAVRRFVAQKESFSRPCLRGPEPSPERSLVA